VAIPEREAWLYRNQAALDRVRAGLEDAAAGKLVDGPYLEADAELAEHMEG
jgi:predicted transcriptional regulator